MNNQISTDKNSLRVVNAFIIVDVQDCFITGNLALSNSSARQNGAEVVPIINHLLQTVSFDIIAFTHDWHPLNHISFFENLDERRKYLKGDQNKTYERMDTVTYTGPKFEMEQVLWPKHCVQETAEVELHKDLMVNSSKNNIFHIKKGNDSDIDSYSAFWDNFKRQETELHNILKQWNVTHVYVAGLATDYCVAATALDAMDLNYTTYLIQDACRGVANESISNKTNEMRQRGIQIIQSRQIWKPFSKYLLTNLNTTFQLKNKHKYQSWIIYSKHRFPRFLCSPFLHNFIVRDINLHLQTYENERKIFFWWKEFSSYTFLTYVLQSTWPFETRLSFNSQYYLLTHIEQSKTINFLNPNDYIHPVRFVSSSIDHHNQNTQLQQLIEQYQDHSHVDLSEHQLTDEDMKIISKEILIRKQCKQLVLKSNRITSVGVSILAQTLHNNNSLNYLDLSSNQVSDDGVHFLSKILSMNSNTLKKLDLGKNRITDDGMKHLAQMIKTNKILTQLDLCSNEITDEGIRLLANAIENSNSTIELLWLTSNTLITDKSIESIIGMVKKNQSLKRLWMFKCNLSEIGKKKLKELEQLNKNFRVYVNNWKD
ncbi:unnamed protein product [Adineta steineri]|uniref:nicotinamidase n=1 Tax=Adineta steineri TaxID=433720 RepID=A0A819EYZ0_9BILA|nr:unnamed protein product [Adineta steineri]